MMEFDDRQPFNIPSCSHEIESIEYLSSEEELEVYELDHFQHMDEKNLTEDQILMHLEELIEKVIFGTLHHEMMDMSRY